MYTYQDFITQIEESNITDAVSTAIKGHMSSELYKNALEADRYDHQQNTTIMSYVKWLYSENGRQTVDPLASNHKLCSNFFNRLNTQRMTYSLGNGITFTKEDTKAKLGDNIDTQIRSIGYYSLIHGVCFAFWNMNHLEFMRVTEFAPLWDEETSSLKAGIRFWQIDKDKPCVAVLYEADGYTTFKGNSGMTDFKLAEEKHSYKVTVRKAPVDQEEVVVGTENYSSLPIVAFWGSRLHQSTIVGMKAQIDAYDLVRSGFANDMADCSEIYWIVSGAGGADESDLARFRDRLKFNHIASVTNAGDTPVTPYTQNIPYESREAFLKEIRSGIYEDFGSLDVYAISASNQTATAIESAYQPMDENADDYEYQLIDGVQNVLVLIGVEDTPIFKRNRISNQSETTNMILSAAEYLDDETILNKLPFITPDEVLTILGKKDEEDAQRLLNEADDEDESGADT